MRRTSKVRTLMPIQRPCLNCGTLTTQTRCPTCTTIHNRTRNKPKPAHRRGNYKQRAKQIVKQATHCWLCGEGARINDPFTADHVIAGDIHSPLLPAHRTCNSRRGNRDPIEWMRVHHPERIGHQPASDTAQPATPTGERPPAATIFPQG